MLEKLKNLFDIKFWKFALVGVVNTIFGNGVMFLLYNVFHASYWLSSAANYVLGSILSYFLNKYFTFRARERSWAEIGRFVLNIAVCYGAAYGVARPLLRRVLAASSGAVQDNAAMALGMVLFIGLNYLGQRFFVFPEKKPSGDAGEDRP